MSILSDEFYYQLIRIDTINTRVYADIIAKEGDANGRGLLLTLTENGLMKDTTGIALNLKWEHTSVGNQGLDNFDAVDLSKGLYKITYPTEMLNRGKIRAFIQIVDSGKLAGTRNIEITVDRGVGDDIAIASSDSFTALAQALIDVNNLEETYAPELLSVKQQLAESPYKREHHYYVGATQKYTTITAAYNQWVADGRPKATIHILSGIYTETLVILNNVSNPYELSFVGENKKDVIWKSTNGYYKDSPLSYQGDGVIKGITFVADHSANPSYAYSRVSGNVWGDPVGGAYALHVDFAGAGTTLIQDCDLISYQNAGLGCGTRKDQTIALENVNIYSYTEVETGSAEQLGNGGLLYHTTNEEGATNQRLTLKNVKVFSENGNPFVYTHYSQDAVGATLEVITSNFASNAVTTRRNLFKLNEGPQPLLLTKNSYGNNVESLNSIYSSDPIKALALTQPDGKCLQITNWNDVYYGFVMGDGTSLNAPVDGVWFIGYAFTYGYESYTEQYAWQITSAHEKFRRSKTGAVWGAWERCYETLSEINSIRS